MAQGRAVPQRQWARDSAVSRASPDLWTKRESNQGAILSLTNPPQPIAFKG